MDICKGVFDRLDMDYKFTQVQFDSIVTGVSSGKYTMGASGFTITDERKESVIFSDSYASVNNVVVVKTGYAHDLAYLKTGSAKSAVQNGTTGHLIAMDVLGNDHVLSLSTYSDVFAHLRENKVDAIVLDSDTAHGFIHSSDNEGDYRILEEPISDVEEYYAFIFSKDNTELRDKFNTALGELREEGVIDDIINYYKDRNFSEETISYWEYLKQLKA